MSIFAWHYDIYIPHVIKLIQLMKKLFPGARCYLRVRCLMLTVIENYNLFRNNLHLYWCHKLFFSSGISGGLECLFLCCFDGFLVGDWLVIILAVWRLCWRNTLSAITAHNWLSHKTPHQIIAYSKMIQPLYWFWSTGVWFLACCWGLFSP